VALAIDSVQHQGVTIGSSILEVDTDNDNDSGNSTRTQIIY
jgi:hypothetical protein